MPGGLECPGEACHKPVGAKVENAHGAKAFGLEEASSQRPAGSGSVLSRLEARERESAPGSPPAAQ
eukprot:5457362-Alexandrium_andersonii.AAC.1